VEPHAIINMSNHILLQEEIYILQKGLKFCPTPEKQNTDELRGDVFDFTRKLKTSWNVLWYGR